MKGGSYFRAAFITDEERPFAESKTLRTRFQEIKIPCIHCVLSKPPSMGSLSQKSQLNHSQLLVASSTLQKDGRFHSLRLSARSYRDLAKELGGAELHELNIRALLVSAHFNSEAWSDALCTRESSCAGLWRRLPRIQAFGMANLTLLLKAERMDWDGTISSHKGAAEARHQR